MRLGGSERPWPWSGGDGEAVLQEILPGTGATAVAASGIGEYDDFSSIGIAQAAFVLPPRDNAVYRKLRSIEGASDETSGIGFQVINAIGYLPPCHRTGKGSHSVGTGIPEPPDHFLFPSINSFHMKGFMVICHIFCTWQWLPFRG